MNKDQSQEPLRLASLRPLVRYVDDSQAIIDAHLAFHPPLPTATDRSKPPATVEVLLEIHGPDGSMDEHRATVALDGGGGFVRFEVVHPQRWWPAGMGEQALYEFSVSVLVDEGVADRRTMILGFTSVRCAAGGASPAELLVNGQVCGIKGVLPVDAVHERGLLPVGGQTLLLVRGHYGTDVLYDAADRAGILLVQSVPIDPLGRPEAAMMEEVERLGTHPSLAGWFVGHLGQLSRQAEGFLRQLDPTRSVFKSVPGLS